MIPYLHRQQTLHVRQARGVSFHTEVSGPGGGFVLPCRAEWWTSGPVTLLYRTGTTRFPSSDPRARTAYKQHKQQLFLLYARMVTYINT